MVRCFIGILIPEDLKAKIRTIKKELEKLPMKCKFVEDENLHICLSFLGEVEEENLKTLYNKLDEITKKFENFVVEINGIKMIPNERYVRVLALDVLDKSGLLHTLNENIKKEIGGDSKPPHLTLCRVKTVKDKTDFIEKIKAISKTIDSFNVKYLQVIKSELRKIGPVYTVIHESKFIR